MIGDEIWWLVRLGDMKCYMEWDVSELYAVVDYKQSSRKRRKKNKENENENITKKKVKKWDIINWFAYLHSLFSIKIFIQYTKLPSSFGKQMRLKLMSKLKLMIIMVCGLWWNWGWKNIYSLWAWHFEITFSSYIFGQSEFRPYKTICYLTTILKTKTPSKKTLLNNKCRFFFKKTWVKIDISC